MCTRSRKVVLITLYYEDVLGRRGKARYTFLILELNGGEQSDSCSSHCNPGESSWYPQERRMDGQQMVWQREYVQATYENYENWRSSLHADKKPTIELWDISIHFTCSLFWRAILIFSWLRFTNIKSVFVSSVHVKCPVHVILLDFITHLRDFKHTL